MSVVTTGPPGSGSPDWSDLPLTPDHARWLAGSAISPAVAASAGLVSIVSADQLPPGTQWAGERGVPAVVFPWRSPAGLVTLQVRPDVAIVTPNDPDGVKYIWPAESPSHLNEIIAAPESRTVLLVEGTKQPLAAASYAPDVAVYGMLGCRGYMFDGAPLPDLAVVDDRDVVVLLDGDIATNHDVWTAAKKLPAALDLFAPRSVRFVTLPVASTGKRNALDDLLARYPEPARAPMLARMIERATAQLPKEPARKKRGREPGTGPSLPSTADRPLVWIDGDKLDVINTITGALLDRWNATRLFDHGEAIGQYVAATGKMKVLTDGGFHDLLAETAVTVRHGKDGEAQPAWPDAQTYRSVMSRYHSFAPLERITRAPFVRPDGTVCQVNGYDADTGTLVVMDDGLTGIVVPDDPTDDEIASARKLIMDEWLGDFPFHDAASRANALALVVTPFVRGHVNVAPLAVVDGLQMGVGKNLLADVIHLLATGSPTDPLPWSVGDDAEIRKLITSAFRSGADMFVFDEAHHLDGASLARALTSNTYTDRQLGVSNVLAFPNRVTWVSLGNAVRVEGDISRRVYRIALRPTQANPQDRPTDSFRHPNLLAWTRAHRGELLVGALTLVRAWFARGCPSHSRASSFGSFEQWERTVGGIVGTAGQPGFLANLEEWRSESSFTAGYWTAHIHWLYGHFGERPFTSQESLIAMRSDTFSEPPPGMTDLLVDAKEYSRRLGMAYRGHADRWFDGIQLVREGGAHRNVSKWRVVRRDTAVTVGSLDVPTGGSEGPGGSPTPSRMQENVGVQNGRTDTRVYTRGATSGDPSPSLPTSEPDETTDCVSESVGSDTESALKAEERPYPSDPAVQPSLFSSPETTDVDLSTYVMQSQVSLRDGALAFDVETGSTEKLWTAGPEFVRLAGYQLGDTVRINSGPSELLQMIDDARVVIGHNILGFDLVALARHHALDLVQMANDRRIVDTMLVAVLSNPPEPGVKPDRVIKDYALDALGLAMFEQGKTGDLKALAREFGAFDQIPLDDERYVTYCLGDVDLSSRIAKRLGNPSEYVWREHRVAAIAAQMRLNGFRVDVAELERRITVNEARKAELIARLVDQYGLPGTNAAGKPVKSPQATDAGKAAIDAAFRAVGVELPRTEKSGSPAIGKVVMDTLAVEHADRPDVLELVETVAALNGVRTVYDTVQNTRIGDRVHPDVLMFQASGRWSIKNPGLTVMGKRGGKHVEREVFVPDEGHVIIAADLAQVDARAVAAHCQDNAYLDLFEPGRDSHTEIATAVWGDPGRRQDAKVIGHGWNYGMGLNNLARQCGSYEAAREFHHAMTERFPDLVRWKREIAERGDAGEWLDNGFGRRLRVARGRGWTQGPALMGQSAARDILMEGLLRLPTELVPYLRAVVHDEVVMSVPVADAEEIERAVVDALSFPWAPPGASRPVQIIAATEGRRGTSWGDVYAK